MALLNDRMTAAKYRSGAGTRVPLEEEECMWLYEWAELTLWQGRPIAEVLIHIPNGSFRGYDRKGAAITAGKLKAQGMQPGVYDYLVPVPRLQQGGWLTPGLWLEMKRLKGGGESTEQKDFRRRMLVFGWRCEVKRGWSDAALVIQEYLTGAAQP